MNDRDLVRQTLRGDRAAYRRLIERYRNAVYGLVISFVGDFDLAEDLAQEAFIRGYYRLHTLDDGGRFGGWLRTVAANLCRMELRRRRALPMAVPDYDLDAVEGPLPPPDEAHERDEAQQQVLRALDVLPRKEREAVTLYYLDGECVEAVGQFLSISPGAVKGRLHRARQKLRKEMNEMAKKTLSRKKLGSEFSERIELRKFSDLARLTDEELKALTLRSKKFLSLVYALSGDDPESEAIRNRVLDVLSDRRKALFEINLDCFRKYDSPLCAYQFEVIDAARKLQREGAIRPAPERKQLLPAGKVEIKRFVDIAKLTDYEIYQLLCEVNTKDLADALTGGQDLTGPKKLGLEEVEKRMMSNISERVGRMIEMDRAYRNAPASRAEAMQGHIVQIARSLQASGEIRPGTDPMTAPRVDIRSFEDLVKLTDYEIQALLRETDTKEFGIALNGKGKVVREVERRIFMNFSARIGEMLREEIEFTNPSGEEIEATQRKVVETVKRLQILGCIRLPSRKPTARQYERAIAEVAKDQIERGRHSGRWTPESYGALLPYLAAVIRDEGIEEARKAFDGVSSPIFGVGLQLLAEGTPKEQMVARLEERAEEAQQRLADEYRKGIAGFAAICEGKGPREVGERVERSDPAW